MWSKASRVELHFPASGEAPWRTYNESRQNNMCREAALHGPVLVNREFHVNKETLLVKPVFKTSLNLLGLGAIDVCLNEPPQRCHVLHLTPNEIYLNNSIESVPWLSYVLKYLMTLKIKRNATMVIYTADSLPPALQGFPVVLHTTSNHANTLFT